MTLRQVYERVLIELNKEHAPALLIDDFNHFIMRAIYQYVNKRYNLYNTTQQTSDDLRVLSTTAILPAKLSNKYDFTNAGDIADNPIYEVNDFEQLLFLIKKFKLPLLIKEPFDEKKYDIDIEIFDEYRVK